MPPEPLVINYHASAQMIPEGQFTLDGRPIAPGLYTVQTLTRIEMLGKPEGPKPELRVFDSGDIAGGNLAGLTPPPAQPPEPSSN